MHKNIYIVYIFIFSIVGEIIKLLVNGWRYHRDCSEFLYHFTRETNCLFEFLYEVKYNKYNNTFVYLFQIFI